MTSISISSTLLNGAAAESVGGDEMIMPSSSGRSVKRNLSDWGGSSGSGSDSGNLFEDVDETAEEAAEEASDAAEEAAEDAAEEAEEEAEEAADEADGEAAVSAANTAAGEDCTLDYCENQVSSDYLLRYKVNVPDGMTLESCDETCTISFESIYDGEAWVSVGFSTDGKMIGSDSVM